MLIHLRCARFANVFSSNNGVAWSGSDFWVHRVHVHLQLFQQMTYVHIQVTKPSSSQSNYDGGLQLNIGLLAWDRC